MAQNWIPELAQNWIEVEDNSEGHSLLRTAAGTDWQAESSRPDSDPLRRLNLLPYIILLIVSSKQPF